MLINWSQSPVGIASDLRRIATHANRLWEPTEDQLLEFAEGALALGLLSDERFAALREAMCTLEREVGCVADEVRRAKLPSTAA